MDKATNRLEQSLGYAPRYERAADEIGIDLKLGCDSIRANRRGSSFDELVAHRTTQPLHETVSDPTDAIQRTTCQFCHGDHIYNPQ